MRHKNYLQHQEAKKEMQKFRALSGLCVGCGKLSQFYRCFDCAIVNAENQKRYRRNKKMESVKVKELQNPIVEVKATAIAMNMIRLKFFGLPGDAGPDLIMDEALARETIKQLQSVLPEGIINDKDNSGTTISNNR